MAYRYSNGPPSIRLGSIHYSIVSLNKTLKFFNLMTSQEALASS